MLGIQVLGYALYFILLVAGIVLAVFLGSMCSKWQLLGIVSASVVWVFLLVSLLIASALVTPVSYACISMLYFMYLWIPMGINILITVLLSRLKGRVRNVAAGFQQPACHCNANPAAEFYTKRSAGVHCAVQLPVLC